MLFVGTKIIFYQPLIIFIVNLHCRKAYERTRVVMLLIDYVDVKTVERCVSCTNEGAFSVRL